MFSSSSFLPSLSPCLTVPLRFRFLLSLSSLGRSSRKSSYGLRSAVRSPIAGSGAEAQPKMHFVLCLQNPGNASDDCKYCSISVKQNLKTFWILRLNLISGLFQRPKHLLVTALVFTLFLRHYQMKFDQTNQGSQ